MTLVCGDQHLRVEAGKDVLRSTEADREDKGQHHAEGVEERQDRRNGLLATFELVEPGNDLRVVRHQVHVGEAHGLRHTCCATRVEVDGHVVHARRLADKRSRCRGHHLLEGVDVIGHAAPHLLLLRLCGLDWKLQEHLGTLGEGGRQVDRKDCPAGQVVGEIR